MTTTRREFLRILGVMGGAVMLSSCGSSSRTNTPLPNGYSFSRVFTTGEMLPGSGEAEFIPPFVKIHEKKSDNFPRRRYL